MNQNAKSRGKIYALPNTYEGARESSFESKDFPIMNSVRQILSKEQEQEQSYLHRLNIPSSLKTNESMDSTKLIRERLKNKIDVLRDRISSSHKDTVSSIQDRLSVPIDNMQLNNDQHNVCIDTMRIHSRDGSKSIKGSGLELDDYVNINN